MRKQQDGITTVFISQNAKSNGVIPKTKVEEEGDKMGVCSTPPPPREKVQAITSVLERRE